MKEILMLLGVFALGYVITMGFVYALLKVFFPFQQATDKVEGPVTVMKVNRTSNTNRSTSRLRKVRLANG